MQPAQQDRQVRYNGHVFSSPETAARSLLYPPVKWLSDKQLHGGHFLPYILLCALPALACCLAVNNGQTLMRCLSAHACFVSALNE
jgi:hypothetical protein